MHRLVISAHLDDAVLSAWGAVSDPAARVTVVTVFAGVPAPGTPTRDWEVACGVPDPHGLMVLRRGEDAAALGSCGATWHHLDLLEAPHRGPAPVHRSLVALLQPYCEAADEVWAPAGIGGHPDHLEAGRAALEAAAGRPVVLYADQPYSASWYPPPAEGDAPAERTWLAGLIGASALTPAQSPRRSVLGGAALAAKRKAAGCYVTQVRALAGTFDGFDPAAPCPVELSWPLDPGPPSAPPLWTVGALHGVALPALPADPPGAPFLSVVTRTRGERPETLAEALESLAAQRSRNFELLLMVHGASARGRASVSSVLAQAPDWLRRRTRVERVEGGPAARPFNVARWLGAGRYVACLDDDDVVFPDWVSEFERLAERHPGRVLRTRVVRRFTEPGEGDGDIFPEEFDHLEHLWHNMSPVIGLAYPRRALAALGLRADEALAVLDDWDLLLRCASLLGVASASAVTAAYCNRAAADDSRAVHGDAAFALSERHVVHKADRRPLLLPPGSVSALRAQRAALDAAQEDRRALRIELGGAKEQLARIEEELRAALEGADADREAAALARIERDKVRREADGLAGALAAAGAELAALDDAYRRSTSWRVTRPLRALGGLMRPSRRPGPGSSSATRPAGGEGASAGGGAA